MFGGDWPVCTLAAGYADVLDHALACIGPASEAQRQLFLSGSARHVYRLAGAAEA
jgi:L-fuconolactonase